MTASLSRSNPRTRTRIALGIYRDAYGLAATVKVGKIQRERRFPPDEDLERVKSWQIQKRAELDGERESQPEPCRGTFADDLGRRLKQIAGRPSFKSDRSHLQAWLPFLAKLKRSSVTVDHVQAAVSSWLTAGKSARTIIHRRRVLRELWIGLDGIHARPPIKGVKMPRPEDPHPTPVPLEMIRRVATSLRKGLEHEHRCGPLRTVVRMFAPTPEQTTARFLVRATTGQRPSQIMRAQPEDVDLTRRIWFVHAGKRGRAIPLPLNQDMMDAWRAFIAANAWGRFDTRSFSKTIRRHGWPKGVRPYALRHNFAIDLLLAGADLGDVQGLLGHKQIETTRKFYAPILVARLRSAGARRKMKL